MSYAIIETGGKQYRVAPGDVISVEKLDAQEGSEINFNRFGNTRWQAYRSGR